MLNCFYDTFTNITIRAVCCDFFKKALVSHELAIDEYGGHDDLCSLGHRSVISYVHRRMEVVLSCVVQAFS
jgi:hypothetical protein